MTANRPFLGVAMYHATEPQVLMTRLEEVLSAAGRFVLEPPFQFCHGVSAMTLREGRERSVGRQALTRLTTEVSQGKYIAVRFSQDRFRDGDRNLVGVGLELSFGVGDSAKRGSQPFEVMAYVPVASLIRQGLIDALSAMSAILESPYGFVHVGPDWFTVYAELIAMPLLPLRGPRSPEEDRWRDRLQLYQLKRASIGSSKIRAAYWGNMLGAPFVARLGGIHEVRARAPVAVVEPIPRGGAYLHVTSEPTDALTPDYGAKIRAVEAYLRSISIAPEA